MLHRTRIHIQADHASFAGVREAAAAERQIDWQSNDAVRQNACTECYAAVEIADHLDRISIQAGDSARFDITVGGFDQTPPADIAVLIAGPHPHPVVAALERETGRSLTVSGAAAANSGSGDEARLAAAAESGRIVGVRRGATRCWVVSGADRNGTLYAAYALLEKLGVRWYAPDAYGTVLPAPEAVVGLPDSFDETFAPDYATRGLYTEFSDNRETALLVWAARNKMNFAKMIQADSAHFMKKLGIRVSGNGHELLHRFMNPRSEYPYRHALFGGDGKPEDPYPVSEQYRGDADGDGVLSMSEAHPEWFALIDGRRSFRSASNPDVEGDYWGDNFCTSNPDAAAELSKRIVEDLTDGPNRYVDDYNIWMYDNGIWCQCERCGQTGNYASRMFALLDTIQRHIRAAALEERLQRAVRLIVPAYHELLEPPDRPLPLSLDYGSIIVLFVPIERCYVHTIDDPACTETNRSMIQWYEKWTQQPDRTYRGEVLIGEYFNVSSFASMPIVLTGAMRHDIPYYRRTGSRHFFYMHMPARRWGMLALNNALHAALLWNTALDGDAYIGEYFRLYYRECADTMSASYEWMERGSANMKYIKHYQESGGKRWAFVHAVRGKDPFFPLRHVRYDRREDDPNAGISFLDTIDAYGEARKLLEQAIGSADGAASVAALDAVGGEPVRMRLRDDLMRLDYGQTMLAFYHDMYRTAVALESDPEQAERSFRRAEGFARRLEQMTEPLEAQHYPDLRNGLAATWIEQPFRRLAERFAAAAE